MNEKVLTLSIETAIQGGSISLLEGTTELDYWIGLKEVSKSEDVLQEIKNILDRNDKEKDELKKIVVSRGPGSHTGLRIGMAVGIGLRKALNCELISVSPLEAMLSVCKMEKINDEKGIVTVIPIGKNQICRQNFKLCNHSLIENETVPLLMTAEEFASSIFNNEGQLKKKIILHRKLFLELQPKYKNPLTENIILMDAGVNIALLNGITAAKRIASASVSNPVYVREKI